MRRRRLAGRVVVLDVSRSTFLFRYDDAEVGRHWATPGGGLEPGETFRQGARRELIEETGWLDLEPGPLLCTWEHDFTRFGAPVTQYEQIFVTCAAHRPPEGNLAVAHRVDEILEWRWWSLDELTTTREQLWPPQLASLLEGLPTDLDSVRPVHLGHVD